MSSFINGIEIEVIVSAKDKIIIGGEFDDFLGGEFFRSFELAVEFKVESWVVCMCLVVVRFACVSCSARVVGGTHWTTYWGA